MQQLPVIPAPLGAASATTRSPATASSAGTTLFGIEFSTALFRAFQTAIPTGTDLLNAASAEQSGSGLNGLPSLLANLSTVLTNEMPLAANEDQIFPFLGKLLSQPQVAEPQVPVSDFVIPELPALTPTIAIDTPVSDAPPELATFELPFDEVLKSFESQIQSLHASQIKPETDAPTPVPSGDHQEALLHRLQGSETAIPSAPQEGKAASAESVSSNISPDVLAATTPVSVPVLGETQPRSPVQFTNPEEGLGQRSQALPLSFLPKETRLEVPRAVLGRFQSLRSREVDLPPPNLSMLTPAEQATVGVSTEDRNATVLARIDRVEFVSRMTQALERARLESPKSIELELNPPSLGRLRIEVIDVEGQLTARIQTESSSARSLLLEHLPVLDRHLGEHGIEMQRLQVDQAKETTSSFANGGNPNNRQNPQSQDQPRQSHPPWQWQQRNEEGERGPPISLSVLLALAPGMDRLI